MGAVEELTAEGEFGARDLRPLPLKFQRAQFAKDAKAGKVLCITDLLISTGM